MRNSFLKGLCGINCTGLIIFFVFFSSAAGVCTGQPVANFSEKAFNFGLIREVDGKRDHEFIFTNTGNLPLVILKVESSCGCTATDWTRTPIEPGGKGSVRAIFDPADRPGIFLKTITVHTNSKPSVVTLTLKGEVSGREKSVEELFKWSSGAVRFEAGEFVFDRTIKGDKKIRVMPAINTSGEKVKVKFSGLPGFISLRCIPEVLRPGQKGIIECMYNSSGDARIGFVMETAVIRLNGVVQERFMSISANLIMDLRVPEDDGLSDAPVFSTPERRIDAGNIEDHAVKVIFLKILNKGGRDLVISDIRPSGCNIAVKQGKGLVIRPGESGEIVVALNFCGRRGNISSPLYVYSNDPLNSQAVIILNAFFGSEPENRQ